MADFKTEQESFWAGRFGDEYSERNNDENLVNGNIGLFSDIFRNTKDISSLIEFGANIGLNLVAIRNIMPRVDMSAVEINAHAADSLRKLGNIEVYNDSILNFKPDRQRDLVLVKGVLIHMNPSVLRDVFAVLYNSSRKYICLVEYYNPTPVEVSYRGNLDKLFKRDFAGDFMDMYPSVHLLDYGFKYHRDDGFYDDLNWFLLQK